MLKKKPKNKKTDSSGLKMRLQSERTYQMKATMNEDPHVDKWVKHFRISKMRRDV